MSNIRKGDRVIVISGRDKGKKGEVLKVFPDENRALWDLATAGKWKEARELYRWYTPLLHLDTKVKLVQYIKLAMAEVGLGSEMTRAPKLPIVGAEREEILKIIRTAIATRPKLNHASSHQA